MYWMPDQVGHDNYFSLWGIVVSAYFTLLEIDVLDARSSRA